MQIWKKCTQSKILGLLNSFEMKLFLAINWFKNTALKSHSCDHTTMSKVQYLGEGRDSTPVKPLLAAKKAIINWRNVSPPIAAKKPRIYWFNLDTCLPPHTRAQRKKQRRVENPHSVVSHEKKRHNSFLLSLLFIISI